MLGAQVRFSRQRLENLNGIAAIDLIYKLRPRSAVSLLLDFAWALSPIERAEDWLVIGGVECKAHLLRHTGLLLLRPLTSGLQDVFRGHGEAILLLHALFFLTPTTLLSGAGPPGVSVPQMPRPEG
jgi:hypothetical protein